MVTVQFVVRVPDVERFVAAAKRFEQASIELGARNPRVLVDENDPGVVSMMADWESHDAMHAARCVGEAGRGLQPGGRDRGARLDHLRLARAVAAGSRAGRPHLLEGPFLGGT